MKLPTEYNDDFLGYETGFGGTFPDGTPITAPPTRVYLLIYPPIGFFPFYGNGCGDYHGFYWPIGREEGPPIAAFSSHYVSSLIPEHSTIESLYCCALARSSDESNTTNHFRRLARQATGKPPAEHDIRDLRCDDFKELLKLDPKSPFYLCVAGDVHVANNELEAAEEYYRQSLHQLPEYVAAHFGLAYVLRRQRRSDEATIHLRQALMGPLAFYGGSFWAETSLPANSFRNDWHRKSLMWLQRSRSFHESLADDPFINSIDKLTFQSGLAVNPDIDVLRDIVDAYAESGRYTNAARIWQLIAERAALETSTFRERYNLNPSTYGTRLAELLELSGNTLRAKLVRNMLSLMDKPEGQYL